MRAMFPLMRLTSDADGVVISYHPAVGATLIAIALLLAIAVFLWRSKTKRQWPLLAAMLVAGWGGLYFATVTVTLTPQSATVSSVVHQNRVLAWRDAAAIYLEMPRSGDPHIVLVDGARRAMRVNVAYLAGVDREQAMAYMSGRTGKMESSRTPAVWERRPKFLDPLSDHQI